MYATELSFENANLAASRRGRKNAQETLDLSFTLFRPWLLIAGGESAKQIYVIHVIFKSLGVCSVH
jgi:hypothetical protein